MIDCLRDYQDKVLSVMGRADALLDSAVPDPRALAQCRWELARILRAYQIHKHHRVFDPIIAAGAPAARVALARDLKSACVRMGDRFRDYLLGWSGTSVCDEWSRYRPAAIAMIAELRAHIDRERAGIARLEAPPAASPPPRNPTPPPRTPLSHY